MNPPILHESQYDLSGSPFFRSISMASEAFRQLAVFAGRNEIPHFQDLFTICGNASMSLRAETIMARGKATGWRARNSWAARSATSTPGRLNGAPPAKARCHPRQGWLGEHRSPSAGPQCGDKYPPTMQPKNGAE